jgi:hypothetical protein
MARQRFRIAPAAFSTIIAINPDAFGFGYMHCRVEEISQIGKTPCPIGAIEPEELM